MKALANQALDALSAPSVCFHSPTADISDVVLLTPGASGTTNGNGPGLSESKTVLRGFQDGQFNITYDGIPWGDANGPTHHSTSFFPASTIGGVIVDRGPGKANDIGPATFGGSINLFSPEVGQEFGGSASLTYGSWNSEQAVVKVNTDALPELGDRYSIRSIPTMAVFKNGNEVARQTGAMPAARIQQFIEQAAATTR